MQFLNFQRIFNHQHAFVFKYFSNELVEIERFLQNHAKHEFFFKDLFFLFLLKILIGPDDCCERLTNFKFFFVV